MQELDVSRCPRCLAPEPFRELAKRHTWQPLDLHVDAVTGELREGEYRDFDYGDDVEVTGYECLECTSQWESLPHLHAELVLAAVAERLENAAGWLCAAIAPSATPDLEPIQEVKDDLDGLLELVRAILPAPEQAEAA